MFIKDYYAKYDISAPFAQNRTSYIHSGIDYKGIKEDKIYSLLDGIVHDIKLAKKYFGYQSIIMSNPKFIGGVNESLYHSYCHMYKILVHKGDFVSAGKQLGYMGNSGGCMTIFNENGTIRSNNNYRYITFKEQADSECNFGVHLHLWFYQWAKEGKKTSLVEHIEKLHLTKNFKEIPYFWQWSRLIINPQIIYKYFNYLEQIR